MRLFDLDDLKQIKLFLYTVEEVAKQKNSLAQDMGNEQGSRSTNKIINK